MIIFINGSINSGKNTIAKLLAEKIEKSFGEIIDNTKQTPEKTVKIILSKIKLNDK
jgi:deoxyadenosine/deoxycytidine kinase